MLPKKNQTPSGQFSGQSQIVFKISQLPKKCSPENRRTETVNIIGYAKMGFHFEIGSSQEFEKNYLQTILNFFEPKTDTCQTSGKTRYILIIWVIGSEKLKHACNFYNETAGRISLQKKIKRQKIEKSNNFQITYVTFYK